MEGRSLLERGFWVLAICGGFAVAGILVSASLRDAGANPIVTSVETISVQVKKKNVFLLRIPLMLLVFFRYYYLCCGCYCFYCR